MLELYRPFPHLLLQILLLELHLPPNLYIFARNLVLTPTPFGLCGPSDPVALAALHCLLLLLLKATLEQVRSPYISSYAVLFSGGVDSTLLCAILHTVLPSHIVLELVNVTCVRGGTADVSPDRQTCLQSFNELCTILPDAQSRFRLVLVDITFEDIVAHCELVRQLIHPRNTIMDFNIGCILYFASRGIGVLYGTDQSYTVQSSILFTGTGADELFAGYTRHRMVFNKFQSVSNSSACGVADAYAALRDELNRDRVRLWVRNLGRDDRVLGHFYRETRYIFLDEDIVHFTTCFALDTTTILPTGHFIFPIQLLYDCTLPKGVGDKKLLRLLLTKFQLADVSRFSKRAMQFGTRIAISSVPGTRVLPSHV
uniref:Asparagine synthetase domain-containing protein 1 n=1 Tax=Lygus hesperus TaxID=30085 RepID=A0A0A9XT36_LYGHE